MGKIAAAPQPGRAALSAKKKAWEQGATDREQPLPLSEKPENPNRLGVICVA